MGQHKTTTINKSNLQRSPRYAKCRRRALLGYKRRCCCNSCCRAATLPGGNDGRCQNREKQNTSRHRPPHSHTSLCTQQRRSTYHTDDGRAGRGGGVRVSYIDGGGIDLRTVSRLVAISSSRTARTGSRRFELGAPLSHTTTSRPVFLRLVSRGMWMCAVVF